MNKNSRKVMLSVEDRIFSPLSGDHNKGEQLLRNRKKKMILMLGSLVSLAKMLKLELSDEERGEAFAVRSDMSLLARGIDFAAAADAEEQQPGTERAQDQDEDEEEDWDREIEQARKESITDEQFSEFLRKIGDEERANKAAQEM